MACGRKWTGSRRRSRAPTCSSMIPRLTGYLRELIGTVGGPAAKDFRIYLARIPDFNAFMFPTGFAVVFSGLLLRMRNEAQLAGVIAHESGHFLRRHMIRSWRDQRRKTDIFSIGAMLAGVGGAGAGVYLGDYVQLAQLGTILSLFKYSRDMESEADAMGAKLIAEAGYDPMEASNVWLQLIGEEKASAAYRGKHRKRGSLFDTHPSDDARMADLRADALELKVPGRRYDNHRARYLATIGIDPPDPARRPGQAERPGREPISDRDARPGRVGRSAPFLRGRSVAAPQPQGRRRARRAKLRRRGRLSRCAGGRLALARHHLDEGRSERRSEGGLRQISDDEARCARRRLGAADDRLRRGEVKRFPTALLLAASALAVSACSSLGAGESGFSAYSAVNVHRTKVGNGNMTVVPPRPWNRHRATPFRRMFRRSRTGPSTAPILDGVTFITGLRSGRFMVRQRRTTDQQVPEVPLRT